MGGGYEGKSGVSEAAVGEGERILIRGFQLGMRTGAVLKRGGSDPHGTQTLQPQVSPAITRNPFPAPPVLSLSGCYSRPRRAVASGPGLYGLR